MASKAKTADKENYQSAGPTLLSQEPNDVQEKKLPVEKQREWNLLRGHLEQELTALRNWRYVWYNTNWSELAQYIEPRRSIWMTQSAGGFPSPNNMTRGRPLNNSIVDPTGTYAVRVCASGLMSGLASPSRPWFKVKPKVDIELDAQGREWLDEVEERIYTVLAGSNFYNSFYVECEDDVVFGTAPCIIYEDEREVIRCYNPVVGEYYLSSGATMRVDGLYRALVMTIKQIVDFFGLENCPPEVVKMWQQKGSGLEQERIIAHSIEPNFEVGDNGEGKVPGDYTWREVYWVWGARSEKPLSMRGFMDQPFTASRWSTQSNDAYGRSVGMDVLPDIIQLQVETLRKAEGIEKQVRPPLLASMELKNQPSSILPGHVTYVQNLGPGAGMRPIYEVNPDLNAMMQDLAEIQQRIKTGFFNDLFLMLEQARDAKITAYEVAQKMQEKLQVLGPVIENLISESLRPRLKRVFSIMQRKGLIPPPPDSMKGIPLDVDFVSMLVLAQKAAATGGIERLVALVGNMVAVFPEVKDNLDPDETIREMNDLLGNPQKIIRGLEQIKQIRAQQQAQQAKVQQQQQLAHSVAVGSTAAKAAQVLAGTQIGGGTSALSALVGSPS